MKTKLNINSRQLEGAACCLQSPQLFSTRFQSRHCFSCKTTCNRVVGCFIECKLLFFLKEYFSLLMLTRYPFHFLFFCFNSYILVKQFTECMQLKKIDLSMSLRIIKRSFNNRDLFFLSFPPIQNFLIFNFRKLYDRQ